MEFVLKWAIKKTKFAFKKRPKKDIDFLLLAKIQCLLLSENEKLNFYSWKLWFCYFSSFDSVWLYVIFHYNESEF